MIFPPVEPGFVEFFKGQSLILQPAHGNVLSETLQILRNPLDGARYLWYAIHTRQSRGEGERPLRGDSVDLAQLSSPLCVSGRVISPSLLYLLLKVTYALFW